MSPILAIQKLNHFLSLCADMICKLIIVLMMLQIVADVFMRKLFGSGFPLTPELVSKYYMLSVCYIPLALSENNSQQIHATIFTDKMPSCLQPYFKIFGLLLAIIIYTTMCLTSYEEAYIQTMKGAYVETGVMYMVIWPSYWILPLGFFMMSVACIAKCVSVWQNRSVNTPEQLHLGAD